jgi:hypothetical protein
MPGKDNGTWSGFLEARGIDLDHCEGEMEGYDELFRRLDDHSMWEQVKAEDVDRILQQTFGGALARIGFLPSARRRWSRNRVPEIRDVFEIQALKGATVSPRWGFSLDFVPHVAPRGVKWHRTAKSAMFDLVDDPCDTMDVKDRRMAPFPMSTLRGTNFLEQAAVASVEASLSQATKIWEQVHSDYDLIGVCEMLRSRQGVRFDFKYIQQPLAFAFILARVGKVEEARLELPKAHAYSNASAAVRSRLDQLLEEAAVRSAG